MKAIVQDRYGAPEVLQFKEVEKPAAGPHDLLVRVHAAAVNARDWHIMRGDPYIVRVMSPSLFGWSGPKMKIRGCDFAGRVEAVGSAVMRFRPGDEVYGDIGAPDGAFAEYLSAPEDLAELKPGNVSFEQAAAVPVAGNTALMGLRDAARLQAGQHILINGSSGGVGTFAVQIAKVFGAEVTGVCSTAKLDAVRALGADHLVDYTTDDFAAGEHRYDVILDIGGNRRLSHLRRALTRRGRLVIVGGETDGRWLGGVDRQVRALLLSPFVSQKLGTFVASENAKDLMTLRELIDSGQLAPAIDRSYPLSEVAAAIRYLLDGRARGKLVITV